MIRKTNARCIPELAVPDDEWKKFVADREGAIVGASTAKRFGWKIGDRIPSKAPIYGGTWEFNIRGIYNGSARRRRSHAVLVSLRLFRRAPHRRKGTIGWYAVKLDYPDDAARVVKAIDDKFANSPYETKTETKKASPLAGSNNSATSNS